MSDKSLITKIFGGAGLAATLSFLGSFSPALAAPPPGAGGRTVQQAGFVPAHERAASASSSMRVVGTNQLRPAAYTAPAPQESVLAEPIPAPMGTPSKSSNPVPMGSMGGEVEIIGDGVISEHFAENGEIWDGASYDPTAASGGDCGCGGGACAGDCGGCSDGGCGDGPYFPGDHWRAKHHSLYSLFKHFQFFSGAHAFKNPGNRGGESSFGFHQGLNFSANLPHCHDISFQVGVQVTESNFNGNLFTDDDRVQLFATGGVFRRVDVGFQGGVVFDYLHDEWDYQVDLMQFRAEISWVYPHYHELGFFTAVSAKDKLIQDPALGTVALDTTDIYAFFYRCRFLGLPGSEGRIYGGFSGDSDGIIGGDYLMPVCANLALQLDYAYLIPNDDVQANLDESWNLGFNLVWYPGCGFTSPNNYCRPLFNVANNGSMMLNNQR